MIHTVRSISSSPCMPLPDLSHARLTIYSTVEKQGWHKTDDLLQNFGFLHQVKPIVNRAVFQCSTLTFYKLIYILLWFTKTLIGPLLYQSKALNCAYGWTKWSPTVISTASATWTTHFQPFHMLNWLYTALATIKVDIKLTIYHSSSVYFTIENNWNTTNFLVITSCLCLKKKKLKAKHVIVQTNVHFDHK